MAKKTIKERVIDYFKKKGTYEQYKEDGSLARRIAKGVWMAKKARKENQALPRFSNQNKLKNLPARGLLQIQQAAKRHGIKDLNITSGRRDRAEAERIFNKRVSSKKHGEIKKDMDKLTPSQQSIVIEAIMREDSKTGELKYGRDNWGSFKSDLIKSGVSKKEASNITDKVGIIRADFSGMQSGHFRGEKIDLAQPLPQSFIEDLKQSGHEILPEEKIGVTDIRFPQDVREEYRVEEQVMKSLDKQVEEQSKPSSPRKTLQESDVEEKSKRLQHMALSSLLKR